MEKSMYQKKILAKLAKIASTKPLIRHSRHVAGVVLDGKIISIGWAQYKTHPLMVQFQDKPERIFLHAEVDAIRKAIARIGERLLSDSELYIVRLSKGGNIGNSRPCETCRAAIEKYEIKNVFWSK